MTVHFDDSIDDGAPQPIDVDAVDKNIFERLGEGQGAVAAKRREADSDGASSQEAEQPIGKRTLIIVAAAGALATVIILVGIIRMLLAPVPIEDEPTDIDQTAVAVDQAIQTRGFSYELVKAGDVYQLVETGGADGQSMVLGDLEGEPAGFVLYDGAIIVPQNNSDGTWSIMAYTIGVGWSKMANQDGSDTGGTGTATAAELEGSTLVVTVDGGRVEVPLVW